MKRQRPIGPRTRERAAILCATRACAESMGAELWLCHPSSAPQVKKLRGIAYDDWTIWTPEGFSTRERQLAYQAFRHAVCRQGVGIGMAPINWAEAEAMIRCGFDPAVPGSGERDTVK